MQAMTREDPELRTLSYEEVLGMATGGGCGSEVHRKSLSCKSPKGGSSSRGVMAKQPGASFPSEALGDFGHVQARAWAGQVMMIPVYYNEVEFFAETNVPRLVSVELSQMENNLSHTWKSSRM